MTRYSGSRIPGAGAIERSSSPLGPDGDGHGFSEACLSEVGRPDQPQFGRWIDAALTSILVGLILTLLLATMAEASQPPGTRTQRRQRPPRPAETNLQKPALPKDEAEQQILKAIQAAQEGQRNANVSNNDLS